MCAERAQRGKLQNKKETKMKEESASTQNKSYIS